MFLSDLLTQYDRFQMKRAFGYDTIPSIESSEDFRSALNDPADLHCFPFEGCGSCPDEDDLHAADLLNGLGGNYERLPVEGRGQQHSGEHVEFETRVTIGQFTSNSCCPGSGIENVADIRHAADELAVRIRIDSDRRGPALLNTAEILLVDFGLYPYLGYVGNLKQFGIGVDRLIAIQQETIVQALAGKELRAMADPASRKKINWKEDAS